MAGDLKLRFFGRVEWNIAGPANFKDFFHRASVKFRRSSIGRVCCTGVCVLEMEGIFFNPNLYGVL